MSVVSVCYCCVQFNESAQFVKCAAQFG